MFATRLTILKMYTNEHSVQNVHSVIFCIDYRENTQVSFAFRENQTTGTLKSGTIFIYLSLKEL